jgi:hypothetical protein
MHVISLVTPDAIYSAQRTQVPRDGATCYLDLNMARQQAALFESIDRSA